MLVRVSISLACLALLVLGTVLVMDGGSDQVSVNGLETQQASRDEGAVASADGRAGDRGEARSKSEAAEVDSGRMIMTNEMFNALPDEKKAAVAMGVDISKYDSALDYFNYLDSSVKAGDLSLSLEAASFYNRCMIKMKGDAVRILDDPSHPAYLMMKECSKFPDLGRDYAATLVENAALAGDREAIVLQFLYLPVDVISNPGSEESRRWIEAAAVRLEKLAGEGDIEAMRQLARVYLNTNYALNDDARAVEYIQAYIENAPPNTPELGPMHKLLTQVCAVGAFDKGANPCRQ